MYCKDCRFNDQHWCDCPKIRECHYGEYPKPESCDEMIYSYYESGSFWVGDLFGCIHFKQK